MSAIEKIKDLLHQAFKEEESVARISYDSENRSYIFPPEATTPANKILRLLHQRGETSTRLISFITDIDSAELKPVLNHLRDEGRISTIDCRECFQSACHRFNKPDCLPVRLAMKACDTITPFLKRA